MSQTSYSVNQAVARAGLPYDISFAQDIVSENLAADSQVGCLVVRDSADGSAKLPALATDITNAGSVIGVLLHEHMVEQPYPMGSATPIWPAKSTAPVMKKGRVWVSVEAAVSAGAAVYARFATGSFSQKGAFRGDADTASAAIVPNAKYITSTTGAGLAVVELATV
jgi:hypothetical protein